MHQKKKKKNKFNKIKTSVSYCDPHWNRNLNPIWLYDHVMLSSGIYISFFIVITEGKLLKCIFHHKSFTPTLMDYFPPCDFGKIKCIFVYSGVYDINIRTLSFPRQIVRISEMLSLMIKFLFIMIVNTVFFAFRMK